MWWCGVVVWGWFFFYFLNPSPQVVGRGFRKCVVVWCGVVVWGSF